MASSPTPLALDELGSRRFSFYPPIVGIDHNEWEVKQGSWSEILVHNPKMEMDIWIPRAYMGEISKIEEPVMIVGLKRELEYKGGQITPYVRRVLSMPRSNEAAPAPTNEITRPHTRDQLRMDTSAESKVGRLILAVIVGGILLTAVLAGVLRMRNSGGAVEFKPIVQADLGFTAQSDYFDVVNKLGQPDQDRWRSESGERQYRALTFKKDGLVVILMGAERNSVRYIGAKDLEWRTVHSVELPGGNSTAAILRSLPKF